MSKITAYGELATPPDVGDELYIVDVSDTTQGAGGTGKRIKARTLLGSEPLSANATATGAVTLDLAVATVFALTLTGNVTLTFTGASAGRAYGFGLQVKQDGTGSRTVTWPASVKWPGGSAPTQSTAAGAVDKYVFETVDGGTTWDGSLVGANFS